VFIAYLAGLLTLPALVGGYFLFNWAFSRTQAYGDCIACEHLPEHEIGEAYNISEWTRAQRHDLWWSHRAWHRKAVAEDHQRHS
jgi:hypothetical protein